jgi:excisionase family DNA binding protein
MAIGELPIIEEESPVRGKLDLDLYNVPDLCERLNLNRMTILKEVKEGKLVGIELGGATGYRFFKEDVVAWLRTKATSGRV